MNSNKYYCLLPPPLMSAAAARCVRCAAAAARPDPRSSARPAALRAVAQRPLGLVLLQIAVRPLLLEVGASRREPAARVPGLCATPAAHPAPALAATAGSAPSVTACRLAALARRMRAALRFQSNPVALVAPLPPARAAPAAGEPSGAGQSDLTAASRTPPAPPSVSATVAG